MDTVSSVRVALFTAGLLLVTADAHAQRLSVQDWIDQFVDMCVGSGSRGVTSGTADANGNVTLRTLSLSGELRGQVMVSRENYRLLTEGISNRMTEVAAGQANAVRECLEPIRRQMLQVMARQFDGATGSARQQSRIQILSPDEERIMRFLATARGPQQVGQLVPESTVRGGAGVGDIRFRIAMRSLQEKLLAGSVADVVSLWPPGEEYVVQAGYAR